MTMFASSAFAASPFEDIDPSHWAYPKIKFLYDHGIIRGTGAGKFDGDERISRYEAAALVYQSLQYVNRTRMEGGQIDADIMDTINSLMTELTDEMQVIEVRIEENSDAIAMLRNHMASMHGKPTQGMSMSMGGNSRLKFMGQGMVSLVSGGANSNYSSAKANNSPVVPVGNPRSGSTGFVADYVALAIAGDVDERTSFFAKINSFQGGDSSTPAAVAAGIDGSLDFNDYAYVHVKDLWSDWDMTLGRMALPWGHEVGGAFRSNPYFVTNSLVDQLYGRKQITGAYFSTDSDDGTWNWGIGVHNGDQNDPYLGYSHLNPLAQTATIGLPGGGIVPVVPSIPAVAGTGFTNFPLSPFQAVPAGGANGVNDNEDDAFGFILHVGSRSADGDFRWDLNYFTNGGDSSTNAAQTGVAGMGNMSYFNLGADYRLNSDWAVSAEFVSGSVETLNASLVGGALVLNNPRGLAGATPSAIVEDDFTTFYLQIVYNLDYKSTIALRVGDHSYDATIGSVPAVANTPVAATGYTGRPDDEVSEIALAYSRKVSDNGTLLVEYNQTEWDLMGGFNKTGCSVAGASCVDDLDVVRASYRVDF